MEKSAGTWFNIYKQNFNIILEDIMKTRVKVAVQMKAPGVPGWPCINYDYDKELARVMEPVYARNPDIEFDIFKYTNVEMAKADYESDLEKYDGVLPDTMEALLRFPGVGRKVANLLLGDLYGTGGIVADTHCIRICGRFGMYPQTLKDPVRVERIMNALVPLQDRCAFCHRIVQFGRDVCSARNPRCDSCPIAPLCEHGKKQKKL